MTVWNMLPHHNSEPVIGSAPLAEMETRSAAITTVLPNFFIVGAPKAGTTALYHYLDQHPEIYMSPIKEPNYFASEVRPENLSETLQEQSRNDQAALCEYLRGSMLEKRFGALVTNWDDYVELFRNVKGESAIGEASVTYLWSVTAAKNIRARISDARIVMVLRNPAERAYSQYLENLTNSRIHNSLREQIQFSARSSGGPFQPMRPFLELGLYYEQVKRFLGQFPREKICILWYEHYQTNPKQAMTDIFRFLGVDPTFEPNTKERHLEPRVHRSFAVSHFLKRYGIWQRLRTLSPRFLVPQLRALAFRKRQSVKMTHEDRQLLIDYYKDDVKKLSGLLNRDLQHWLC